MHAALTSAERYGREAAGNVENHSEALRKHRLNGNIQMQLNLVFVHQFMSVIKESGTHKRIGSTK